MKKYFKSFSSQVTQRKKNTAQKDAKLTLHDSREANISLSVSISQFTFTKEQRRQARRWRRSLGTVSNAIMLTSWRKSSGKYQKYQTDDCFEYASVAGE